VFYNKLQQFSTSIARVYTIRHIKSKYKQIWRKFHHQSVSLLSFYFPFLS